MKDFDFFISHASEDKVDAAIPIADALESRGYRVWIDKGELTIGDRLFKSINQGLSRARFGVVILSPDFFQKDWPQWELEGLMAIENNEGRKVILPVWHRIDFRQIAEVAPLLAGRLATQTSKGIDRLVDDLVRAFEHGADASAIDAEPLPHVPSLEQLFQLEPLDLYADGEEQMELGHQAVNRIVAGMTGFTAKTTALRDEIELLTASKRQMTKRAVRAKLNEWVPICDEYARVLSENAHILGESTGKALLLMTRGLILDKADTRPTRLHWHSVITTVEEVAAESKAVAERNQASVNSIVGYTGDLKRARNNLAARLRGFVAAHDQALADMRDAKFLLRIRHDSNETDFDDSGAD